MAEYGRALFTFAGSFFGPWGTLIGSFLGGLLFPVEGPKGPRLNELNVQHSTVGSPIPIVYGTAALAGNVIWSGGLVETEHEGGGGKGSPSGPTTYSYAVDIAIGICEGTIGGVRRIWADADLIYDASDDATLSERLQGTVDDIADAILGIRALSAQLDFDLYLGDEDQLPDPTIESHEGVGLTPAYRGLAYIVLPNFQLEKFGNRIPNFRFEVFTEGQDEECAIYTAGHLEPWQYVIDNGTFDPRNRDNQHLYAECIDGVTTPSDTFDVAMADMNATLVGVPGDPTYVCPEQPQGVDSEYIRGWALSSTPNFSQPCDSESPSAPDLSVDRVTVTMNLNTIRANPNSCAETGLSLCDYFTEWYQFQWFNGGDQSGFHAVGPDNVYPSPPLPAAAWDGRGDCELPGFGTTNKWAAFDQELCCRRWHAPIDSALFTWTRVSAGQTFKALRQYQETGTFGVVTDYPADPVLRSDHPDYDNQSFWEAAYAAAVDNNASLPLYDPNRIPEDWTYGVEYPNAILSHATNAEGALWQAECTTVTTECIPMSYIVSDICRRAGLRTDTSTQIDVSDLTTCVDGYIVGRQMSGRDALMPLRKFGLWDAVETDGLLKFVERGHALVATLTADDLGAHENGSEAPSLVEVTRVQEKELPRRVRLHFMNKEHDHEVSEQFASRITTEAIDEQDVELAISMAPDTAKQLSEIMLYEAWVSRNAYRFSLDNNWLALEPTDCVEIPVDGQTERVRVVSVDYKIGGIVQIDALRDDDGSYVSTAVAVPGTPSGGAPGSSGGGPLCDSEVVLLDIPRLREQDTDAGYYAAIYGTCDNFSCAELYRSSDGGESYIQVGRTDSETTVGRIIDITGPATDPTVPGDSPAYDDGNTITVELFEGALSSVSDAAIAAGQNTAAIGYYGRWVIIQFKTATLTTNNIYEITDIIWGVNDTQHLLGTTITSDTFVLLSDSSLIRIDESADAIGVSKQFKIISCGQSLDAVDEFDFTTWGLSYERLCPSIVISATISDPPEDPDDGDSYLLSSDTSGLSGVWATHGGEIATWSDETDSWIFCMPVPGTIIHILPEGADSSNEPGGEDVISDGDGNYQPAPWARADATYVTIDDETATLPNSQRLLVEAPLTMTVDTGNMVVIGLDTYDSSLDSGGNTTATYFTHQDESTDLPNSLRLVVEAPLFLDIDTSGNLAVLSLDVYDTSIAGGDSGGDGYPAVLGYSGII